WHGANWTFLVWGALNALYFLPLMVTGRNRRHLDIIAQGRRLPSPGELARLVGTFLLTLLAWVFFRAQNLGHALQYLRGIFSASLFHPMEIQPLAELFMIAFFIAMEWRGREQPYALAALGLRWPRLLRWSLYAFILFLIGMYMQTEETPFIYFQF
ncbi:MAG: MBOAT family protein, partial [Verrucomicrobia bacterium]|nr:MBOAT family protein [Verrucomicrobiota bacterium]